MTFEQALVYIKSLDIYGSVLGLDNMRLLAKEVDNPQDRLKYVHVTGTNGKGSISAFLSDILIDSGYKVGTYNSPAVLSDIDQFRINMQIISESTFSEAVSIVKRAADSVTKKYDIHPTRFEVETMAAFVAFNIERCDIVVLETGLGGRDDATNIIKNALLHIFASISIDHQIVLGNTVSEIAQIKSGIIKNDAPTLMYAGKTKAKPNDAYGVISGKCKELGSKLYTVYDDEIRDIKSEDNYLEFSVPDLISKKIKIQMKGAYQPLNATLAVYAAKILSQNGFCISDLNISRGIEKTSIPFRFQKEKLNDMVDIIFDGAHNPDGAKRLMDSISLNYKDDNVVYITGIFKDKNYDEIAKITAHRASKVFAVENIYSKRALNRNLLAEVLKKYNEDVECAETIGEAIDNAISCALASKKRSAIICFGSLSWLRYAKDYLDTIKHGYLER